MKKVMETSGMSSSNAAIPGMRGLDHIGITVPNLKEAVNFFVNVMGCDAFYKLGPFSNPKENQMEESSNFQSQAETIHMQLVRCGNGSNLELFEYVSPGQNFKVPKNNDTGGHHLAFYVDDIDAAVDYLKTNGIQVLGEPEVMTEGPSAGESWVYFLAPWGMQLELVSYPNGKAYEKTSQKRLFSPIRNMQ